MAFGRALGLSHCIRRSQPLCLHYDYPAIRLDEAWGFILGWWDTASTQGSKGVSGPLGSKQGGIRPPVLRFLLWADVVVDSLQQDSRSQRSCEAVLRKPRDTLRQPLTSTPPPETCLNSIKVDQPSCRARLPAGLAYVLRGNIPTVLEMSVPLLAFLQLIDCRHGELDLEADRHMSGRALGQGGQPAKTPNVFCLQFKHVHLNAPARSDFAFAVTFFHSLFATGCWMLR